MNKLPLLVLVYGSVIISVSAQCTLNVKRDLVAKSPLLFQDGTTSFYRASDTVGTLTFNAGQKVHLACTGTGNTITVIGTQEATATCKRDNEFTIGTRDYVIATLECDYISASEDAQIQQGNGVCSPLNYKAIQVGFRIQKGFSELYTVCHDMSKQNTFYTQFTLRWDAANCCQNTTRPTWDYGKFFDRTLDATKQYTKNKERETLGKLLDSDELVDKYARLFVDDSDGFIAKGHLVAKADFLYAAQQQATFYFINAAPQWQTFNNGNWKKVEDAIRTYAGRHRTDLEIYTGTWGTLTLPDVNGNSIELYLKPGTTAANSKMPVPQIFWKIVHHPSSQRGVVFVGLNNPHYSDANYLLPDIHCIDICPSITWITFRRDEIVQGYVYCCDLGSFRTEFPGTPMLMVKPGGAGILTN